MYLVCPHKFISKGDIFICARTKTTTKKWQYNCNWSWMLHRLVFTHSRDSTRYSRIRELCTYTTGIKAVGLNNYKTNNKSRTTTSTTKHVTKTKYICKHILVHIYKQLLSCCFAATCRATHF